MKTKNGDQQPAGTYSKSLHSLDQTLHTIGFSTEMMLVWHNTDREMVNPFRHYYPGDRIVVEVESINRGEYIEIDIPDYTFRLTFDQLYVWLINGGRCDLLHFINIQSEI